MDIEGSGIIHDSGRAPRHQRNASAISLARLADGTILLTCRLGSDREGADGRTAIFASRDEGEHWERRYFGPEILEWDGWRGETRGWLISGEHASDLRATVLWTDRSDPDLPWVNPETQGLLGMRTYHLRSRDGGATWTDRRRIDFAPAGGASPTGPLVALGRRRVGQPYETWKSYRDASPGRPSARLLVSNDGGASWPEDILVARDPRNEVFFWDQRLATHPGSGRLVAMFWTHEPGRGLDRDVHIAWAEPDGTSWSAPQPTGLPGQHCQPIAVGGDRLLAAYSHRGGEAPGIRVALSEDFGRTWDRATELEAYRSVAGREPGVGTARDASDYWRDMGAWQFGHPRGVALGPGRALIGFYAGLGDARSARWARVRV